MSSKRSQLVNKVVPIVQGILDNEGSLINANDPENFSAIVGKVATSILCNLYGKEQAKKQHRVVVMELREDAAKNLKTELGAKSFSFNIHMLDCNNLSCYENWFNGSDFLHNGRPILPVVRGKSPGFCIFTFNGEILAAVNMYYSNFNSWAGAIGLRKSFRPKTAMPSTHFVYLDEAVKSGLLWFNPRLGVMK